MKIKRTHRIIAIFLTINFLQSFLPYDLLLANNTGPASPEPSSFEPVDAADMVNLTTGDFSYVLPLLDVPGPEGGYPLSLAYHSGIPMGMEASWAGLGWNVNPGAINRNVSGIPDDWKGGRKYSSIYNAGGASTEYHGSIGLAIGGDNENALASIGLYASYSENKTFAGENSYGFDLGINATVGLNDYFGVTGNLGLAGAGVGITGFSGGRGEDDSGVAGTLSVTQSFRTGATKVGLSASGYGDYAVPALSNSSTGISLDSKRGFGANIFHVNTNGNNTLSQRYTTKNDGFSINTPIGVGFGYKRTRYWLYDSDFNTFNGALYAGYMDGLLNDAPFDGRVGFDGYQAIYGHNTNAQARNPNFTHVAYDSYAVSGQGVSGNMTPRVFQEGDLLLQNETLVAGPNGWTDESAIYDYPPSNGNFSNSIENENLHFYFKNEHASYLKVTSNNWNVPSSGPNYSDIFSFDTQSQSLDQFTTIDGTVYDGYNNSNKRLRTGMYVEAYTNDQINNSQVPNFIEAKFFNRNNAALVPEDGVGAYKITTTDGKTYHYSLPVYQREMFRRTTELDSDPSFEFSEQSQIKPYATHWLLTAITGPDYIDADNNGQVNENDYGYWVEFEYGKWSDGFTWRNPTNSGYETNRLTKNHQWGVKDIYYLDKVRTRTHTALFVKEERLDNMASQIDISDGSNGPVVYNDHLISPLLRGDDDNYYLNGIYDKVQTNLATAYYTVYSKHEIFAKTYQHKSLKLARIILLPNEASGANVSKTYAGESTGTLAGEIEIDEEFDVYAINGPFVGTYPSPITDRTWNGQFYNKVLDVEDIEQNAPDINSEAIKTIEFVHNYTLSPNSPNSVENNGYKLTLHGVYTTGKNGLSVLPPYTFEYKNPDTPYDNDAKDDWGYNPNPADWSLNKIVTPLGETLDIVYQEDEYYTEAAETNLVFGERLKMKFTGTDSGPKYVTFRNRDDNLPEQDINFNQYFQVGNSSRVNVKYIWNKPSGGQRAADVDKTCTVTAVNGQEVTFQLPTNSASIYERTINICSNTDWVHYRFYSAGTDGVVQKTQNFVSEFEPLQCYHVADGQHRTMIRVYSNKEPVNVLGGGVRVKDIVLSGEGGDTYTTSYNYDTPGTSNSSGITSYAPSKEKKEVKFITELPAPTVFYEYVTVTNKDAQNTETSKKIYEFEVLDPMTVTSGGFNLSDDITLTKTQDVNTQNVTIDGEDTSVRVSKLKLTDNLAKLGRLKSLTTMNSEGQIISKTTNEYLTNAEIKQGIVQESFKTYKKIFSVYHADKYFLTSSEKVTYPSVLKSTTTYSGGIENTVDYTKWDFLTGEALETEALLSDGTETKSQIIPAYHIPEYASTSGSYGMNAKADYENNRNMLTQGAAAYQYIKRNGNWEPIGVGITTWDNDWTYTNYAGTESTPTLEAERIWRVDRGYTWDGDIDADGVFENYNLANDDNFNWTPGMGQQVQWRNTYDITRYDHFSRPMETEDINNNYTSSKMMDDDGKIALVSSAAYGESFYSGAEYDNLPGTLYVDQQIKGESLRSTDKVHTGKYSFKITPSDELGIVLKANRHRAGTYKVSVWVHKDNYQNVKFGLSGGTSEDRNGEVVYAGSWVQLNHYFERTTAQAQTTSTYAITAASGTLYADDVRLHPVEASLSSYVYNQFNELTFVLGPNNMATKYQYDTSGRLIRIFNEISDTPTVTGGFKKAKEFRYNFKREPGSQSGNGCDPVEVYFSGPVVNCWGDLPSSRTLIAEAGTVIDLTLSIEGGNPGDGNGILTINDVNVATVNGTADVILEDYVVPVDNPTVELDHYISNGGTNNTAVLLRISGVGNDCTTAIGTPDVFTDVSHGTNDCDPDPDPTDITWVSFQVYDGECFQVGGIDNVPYNGGISGVQGGSGEYIFNWFYTFYDPETGGSSDFFDIPPSTVSNFTKSFPVGSQYAYCDSQYPWVLTFKCEIVDANDPTISVIAEASGAAINCSCSPH